MFQRRKVDENAAPLFGRVDWWAFWASALIALVVYTYTLAPSVTLEDGGELAVAGDWLGVPHPPGYPSWTMLAWLFARAFSFITFRGQPNPTWGIAFLSAFFGALSAGLAALLICRSGRDILHRSSALSHSMGARLEGAVCWVAGVSSSLLFAFTPIMWSQSVIVEVYSLNAFFLILVMLLVYVWMCCPRDRYLYWAALFFGIGLTNYQVLLLAALALAIVVLFKDFELFRDFAVVGGPIVAVILLLYVGILPPIPHPTAPVWYLYFGLNGALLILAYYFLPRGKTVAITILLAQLGVAVYAYMPIVSDLRNPPMNWGYPRTWQGFMHAVSRGQYEQIRPTDLFSMRYVQQIGTYMADLRLNFTLLISLIALLPFCSWQWNRSEGRRPFQAMPLAIVLICSSMFLLPFGRIIPLYKIPALGVFLLLAVGAVMMTVLRFREMWERHVLDVGARTWERVTSLVVVLVVCGTYLMLILRKLLDVLEPMRAGEALDGMFYAELFVLIPLLLGVPVLVTWAALRVVVARQGKFELKVEAGMQQWMVSTLIAFATLSLGLIALANLKMDIQDTFIQRVKFISSHLFFSFWIGYGIVFLLAFTDRVLKHRWVTHAVLVVVVLLPVVPILSNAYNEHLILVYGGADQHKRDFGWQFGNYSLRGAPAILEELAPDEEPLPNPAFPPEMGPRAIFFGGTDPGRFVPTYMIYSARVRPDVYLITQNALADGTYLNVMRDLYGNEIWIPSVWDSAAAFGTFVREIESGQRPPMPGVRVENGRVQITGVMGVMEINGILARNIFEYNRDRHDFYVEESYVIRWMYPYLTPHGLIMKINHDPLDTLPREVILDDLDFWDWYTRRFLAHPMFERDVVARKSFSKLRSAIAGLYAYRGLVAESERAFREAMALYPLSPEANFRLAELYMRNMRYEKARNLIQAFREMDPANERVDDFLAQIDGIEQVHNRVMELERQLREGTIRAQDALALADLYRQRGQIDRFRALAGNIANNPEAPSFVLLPLARLYAQAGMRQQATAMVEQAVTRMPEDAPPESLLEVVRVYRELGDGDQLRATLSRYLEVRPRDWRAWLDLASAHAQANDREAAGAALGAAVRFGGAEARQAIETNAQLSRLYQERATSRQGVFGLGL